MMKLCGRIDADQALMRYRYLLRITEHTVPTGKRKKRPVIEQRDVAKRRQRRLADALR
ncbi:MAG: hypothetical protein U9Q94_00890 [Candidatus Bipolaricaulota bacterium]|nr:hypothetical protein [Candidatus Bipolaricaulota bacterium]